jgi:hypothetical protein
MALSARVCVLCVCVLCACVCVCVCAAHARDMDEVGALTVSLVDQVPGRIAAEALAGPNSATHPLLEFSTERGAGSRSNVNVRRHGCIQSSCTAQELCDDKPSRSREKMCAQLVRRGVGEGVNAAMVCTGWLAGRWLAWRGAGGMCRG